MSIMRTVGIVALAASLAAMCGCSQREAAQAEVAPDEQAEVAAIDLPQTQGTPPGEAFIIHLRDGFDEDTQYLGNYAIEQDWIASGFHPDNVRFVPGGMELMIEKRPMKSRPYSGAEFQRIGFYGYGRYEVIMRGVKGQGVIASFFTHTFELFNNDPWDEIDIEYMGKNTRQIHLNHFKGGKAAGSTYIDLPFDYTEEEHLYAFEWEPDAIRWYVDDKLVHEAHEGIPDHSGRVIANLLAVGPGSQDWAGVPDFDAPKLAFYRCMSHVPMGQTAPQCSSTYDIHNLN